MDIVRLKKQGLSKRAVAKRTGISRATGSKYWNETTNPKRPGAPLGIGTNSKAYDPTRTTHEILFAFRPLAIKKGYLKPFEARSYPSF